MRAIWGSSASLSLRTLANWSDSRTTCVRPEGWAEIDVEDSQAVGASRSDESANRVARSWAALGECAEADGVCAVASCSSSSDQGRLSQAVFSAISKVGLPALSSVTLTWPVGCATWET